MQLRRDLTVIRSGENQHDRFSDNLTGVDQTDLRIAAVFGAATVVAQDKDASFVHHQGERNTLVGGSGVVDVDYEDCVS